MVNLTGPEGVDKGKESGPPSLPFELEDGRSVLIHLLVRTDLTGRVTSERLLLVSDP